MTLLGTRATSALILSVWLGLEPVTEARADGPLAPIWNGVYLGVHGGATWENVDTDFSSTFSATNPTGGGHIGFNYGVAGFVVGIEADANLVDSEFNFTTAGGGTKSVSADWNGSVRGRAGITLGPALLYATAGYAWSATSISEKTASGSKLSGEQTFQGVVYGAGVESFVLPNISLRLEMLHYDYSADTLSVSGALKAAEEATPSDTVVRAGVTFHF